jgi:carboxymethylenebutenolidase
MVIEREERTLHVDGSPMRVLLVRPRDATTPLPALIYATDIFGLTPPTIRSIERFAGYGFAVAAFEFYHRFEAQGTALDFERDRQRALDDSQIVGWRDVDADLEALVAHLRADPAIDPERIGAVGFCFGGHVAFRAAFLTEIKRTVAFYGTGIHDGSLGAGGDAGSLARANEIAGDLLLVFGTRDPHVPPEGRATIDDALRRAGTRYAISLYDADHAFMRDEGPRYDPELTDRAYAEAVAFLKFPFDGRPRA